MAQRKARIQERDKWPDFIRKVNVFFRRIRRQEVLTFLLFVLIAAFIWFVQTAREETATDFIVTLNIEAQPQDEVFTTHVPTQLKVTLHDTNTRLFNYRFNRKVQSLSVNFERYADAIGNFRISAAELESLLRASLESSTRIVAVSPSLIDARFAQTEGRKYPVRLQGTYLPADNYRLRELRVTPDSVIINAPTSVLDTLQCVYANDASIYDLRDTLTETLSLSLPVGVKATPAHVELRAAVSKYVEKVFSRIVIRTANVPDGRDLVFFPYAARVSCFVDFQEYHAITDDMFAVTVCYDSIAPGCTRGHLPISVTYSGPQDIVSHIAVEPDSAEFVIYQ